MLKKMLVASVFALVFGGAQAAYSLDCSNQVSISTLSRVLYKNANVHGGRGATLIFQNTSEFPHKNKLRILDSQCNLLGKMGLWPEKNHCPYGYRFYSRYTPGASGTNANALKRKAVANTGLPIVLFEGKGGKWIRVTSPQVERQGNIWSPPQGYCNTRR